MQVLMIGLPPSQELTLNSLLASFVSVLAISYRFRKLIRTFRCRVLRRLSMVISVELQYSQVNESQPQNHSLALHNLVDHQNSSE